MATVRDMTDSANPAPAPQNRVMNDLEAGYMRGNREPAKPSVMVTTSKYLNEPYFRDAWMQFSLRRVGNDVAETYLIPNMSKGIAAVIDPREFHELVEKEKLRYPAFGAWLEARRLKIYDPAELAGYENGTLGESIRTFMVDSGMDIDFMMKGEAPRSDIDYMQKRRGASHDIEHMVSGFGAFHAGEVGLNYLNIAATARFFSPDLAQILSQAAMFTAHAGVYRDSLHYPETLPTILGAVRLGIEAGQSITCPPFMVDWEDYLDWPLADLAAHLGFRRGPAEAWKWTQAACKD